MFAVYLNNEREEPTFATRDAALAWLEDKARNRGDRVGVWHNQHLGLTYVFLYDDAGGIEYTIEEE